MEVFSDCLGIFRIICDFFEISMQTEILTHFLIFLRTVWDLEFFIFRKANEVFLSYLLLESNMSK